MHIENVTINVSTPSAGAAGLLAALFSAPIKSEIGTKPETLQAPAIGQPWPGQGGIYAGLARGEDGQPDHHLILAAEQPAIRLKWDAGVEWAQGLDAEGHKDFALPTRFESALLYANLRDEFDTSAWYWTGTQYSDACAWYQFFHDGSQNYYGKSFEGRVRAVRRLTA